MDNGFLTLEDLLQQMLEDLEKAACENLEYYQIEIKNMGLKIKDA